MKGITIGCVQFDAKLGEPAANRARADALADALGPGDVQLLILPEMAFSGYCFRDRAEIEPFAESAADGPTVAWCRKTARRLQCFVACGFPERAEAVLYNSMVLVDPAGATVHVHRKHFLYATDETWAQEGPAFQCKDVPGLARCGFAICMDVNPKQFKAPFDRYEFASALFEPTLGHHEAYQPTRHRLQANLVIVCNNWLSPESDSALPEDERALHLMNYWARRMSPALGLPVVLAICNRVGVERQTRFAGVSCVIDLQRREILGHLNGTEEGILLVHDARCAP